MNSEQQQLLDKINEENRTPASVPEEGTHNELLPSQLKEIYNLGYQGAINDVKIFCNSRS